MAGKKKNKTDTPTIENRRARFQYEISDTLEVGIALVGAEVKSVRNGNVSLAEGFVRAEGTPPALRLYGVTIGEYGPAGPRQPKTTRTRTLLAHKREIAKFARKSEEKGFTIVPLKLYFKEGWAKLLIGLARGKSKYDKRVSLAAKDAQRDIQRAMSRRM